MRKRKTLLGPPTLLPLRVEVGRRGGRDKRGRKWEEALGLQLTIRGSLLSALGETGISSGRVRCSVRGLEAGAHEISFGDLDNRASFTMHQSLTQQQSSDMSLPDPMGKSSLFS